MRVPDLAAQRLEGGQPGHQVEDLGPQALHRRQPLGRVLPGQAPDEDHEDGDEGDGEGHGQGRGRVLEEHDQGGEGGEGGGQDQLGQVPGEVGLQVVQAAGEHGGGPGGVDGLPAGSERRRVRHDAPAQLDDGAGRGPVGARLLEVHDGGAGGDDRGQGPHEGGGPGSRRAPRHEGGDDAGDEPGLGDDEAGDEHAGDRGGGDVAPGGPRVARESGVQWLHAPTIVRLGPWS